MFFNCLLVETQKYTTRGGAELCILLMIHHEAKLSCVCIRYTTKRSWVVYLPIHHKAKLSCVWCSIHNEAKLSCVCLPLAYPYSKQSENNIIRRLLCILPLEIKWSPTVWNPPYIEWCPWGLCMGDFKPLEIALSPTAKYTTGVV